jgi:hypothetical protein
LIAALLAAIALVLEKLLTVELASAVEVLAVIEAGFTVATEPSVLALDAFIGALEAGTARALLESELV